MTATLVGELNAGALCPPVVTALVPAGAQLSANVTAALALQAQASIGAPPLTQQLASLNAAVTNLQAGIAIGLPGVTFSVADAAALVAAANAALGNLSTLIGLLGGPNMFVYSYSGGTLSTIGSDLSTAITGTPPAGFIGSSPVSGILVGASPGNWATINPFFGGI